MSSYWAVYSGVGLVLREPEYRVFLAAYAKAHKLSETFFDEYCEDVSINEYEFIRAKALVTNMELKPFWVTEITTDTCEGMYFKPFVYNGKPNTFEERGLNIIDYRWSDKDCYVFFSDKNMEGYNAFLEKPYASYGDFVQEFKDKLAAYLPDDFEWDEHLGNFSYACYA